MEENANVNNEAEVQAVPEAPTEVVVEATPVDAPVPEAAEGEVANG